MKAENPKAQKTIETLFPHTGARRLDNLEAHDPEFRRFFENFVYGGMYARNNLDQRTRELCALSALVVQGREMQIESHIRASLNAGASRGDVKEVILQMMVYGGAPATLNGLATMERVFSDLDAEAGAGQV